MPPTRSTPMLTPEGVSSDATVIAQIDRLLRHDPQHQVHAREILKTRDELRAAVTRAGWDSYLHVETALGARFRDALLLVVRWAFERGRNHAASGGP